MKVLIVIVNYRTASLAIRAIESAVQQLEGLDGKVIVVDNDSSDGSYELIAETIEGRAWGNRVEAMAAPQNGGFGYGNNLGIKHALDRADPPEYVFLLNPDAYLDPGAMRTLLRFMDEHPETGIAGSYVHGEDDEPHRTAFRFPSVLGEVEGSLKLGMVTRMLDRWIVAPPVPDQTIEVDWVAGASMMIRRELLDTIGLFDESYFLYFEETDLCRRAHEAGWAVYYVRESSVTHLGSASTGLQDSRRRMPPYWFDSRKHYFRKNHGPAYLWAANMAWVLGFSTWRLRRRLQGKPDCDPPQMLADFVKHNLPRMEYKHGTVNPPKAAQ